MELKKKVVLKVAVLLFLLALTASVDAHRTNLGTPVKIIRGHHHAKSAIAEEEACCDRCVCTKSDPPICRCDDIRLNTCHSACDFCLCLRGGWPTFNWECNCLDETDFCYPPCTPPSGGAPDELPQAH